MNTDKQANENKRRASSKSIAIGYREQAKRRCYCSNIDNCATTSQTPTEGGKEIRLGTLGASILTDLWAAGGGGGSMGQRRAAGLTTAVVEWTLCRGESA